MSCLQANVLFKIFKFVREIFSIFPANMPSLILPANKAEYKQWVAIVAIDAKLKSKLKKHFQTIEEGVKLHYKQAITEGAANSRVLTV